MSTRYEVLDRATRCFHVLKEEYRAANKRLTISAVAKMAKVDRKYFYGYINTSDVSCRNKWVELGREIKLCQSEYGNDETCEVTSELSDADKLRAALMDNYELLGKLGELSHVKSRLEKRLEDMSIQKEVMQERIRVLETRSLSAEESASPVINFNQRAVIIEPDATVSSRSKFERRAAWVKSIDDLRAVLARPVIKDLYITIGVPGSGKSTWSAKFNGTRNFSIILDACNLTKADRFEVLHIAKSFGNVRCIAVVFIAPLDVVLKRNSERISSTKVPEDKILMMSGQIEFPSVDDMQEAFDEIVIVRTYAG